jgi:hypothetical protein
MVGVRRLGKISPGPLLEVESDRWSGDCAGRVRRLFAGVCPQRFLAIGLHRPLGGSSSRLKDGDYFDFSINA